MTQELLALNTEVASIVAAGKQIRRPIEIPRPGQVLESAGRIAHDAAQAGARKAVSVLASTRRGVHR